MTLSLAFSLYGAVILALAACAGGLGVWNRCLRRALDARVRHFAARDPLTTLPSRLLLTDRLSQAIVAANRYGGTVGVLAVGVDRFTAINNTFGHDAGDALLRQAAERLRESVGALDTVGRFGGDEFTIILADAKDTDRVATTARRILARFAEPFHAREHDVYCTASLGIAMHPADGGTAEALLRNAHIAMQRAKDHGRNQFEFFTPEMHAQAVRRLQLETALRGALERREFTLHYQPVLHVATGRLAGYEALIRWQHPEHGLLPPGEFVPILEQSGLIVEVGEWVLATACGQIRRWCDIGTPARIAVNLSAAQFLRPGLENMVERLVRAHGIAPGLLELELTESVLMADPAQAERTLRELKVLGVGIAIDDFGTGYSGLAYLRRFPVDVIKVDRSFLAECDTRDGAVMTRAIVELGHALGLRVVAEGVERPRQLAFLRELRCDEMQGFLFAAAMPAPEAQAWSRHHLGGEEERIA